MRLFAAVRLPQVAQADAAAAVVRVRASCAGPRWIPPERWHLTLAFYGEVPDREVDGLLSRLQRKVRGVPAVSLALAGAGAFGRRALWLGVTGDVVPLRAMAEDLATERRPYRPHLTVARLRGDVDAGPAVEALSSYAGPVWQADAVHLVRSHLGPAPTYEDIATWPLHPAP